MKGPGMPLDWDKLRIFHAAAEAGSFTHAADKLHLSQSAISRQVSALEQDVGVKLFHRHARGLILTEQGELLYRTAHDVLLKLETVKVQLTENTEKPSGKLRVTTTVGLGQGWLTDKVQEFLQAYPDMQIQLILDNEELDVNMRHADCAIRLRQPQQSDLIQRKLFTVHMHVYAAPSYINRFGEPQERWKSSTITGSSPSANRRRTICSTSTGWRRPGAIPTIRGTPHLQINSLTSIKRACLLGIGIAMLPDYIVGRDPGLLQLVTGADVPSFDTYFCYPDEMKNAAKLKAFRDFIVAKARNWNF